MSGHGEVADLVGVLRDIAERSPLTIVRINEAGSSAQVAPGSLRGEETEWLPWSRLFDRSSLEPEVADMARRLGGADTRVAASTLQFSHVARLWTFALGVLIATGRPPDLRAESLRWRGDGSTFEILWAKPHPADSVATEVLHHQLIPYHRAMRTMVSERVLWGNAASALTGAALVLGHPWHPIVTELLAQPQLRDAYDPVSRRRRSCCLFYRTNSLGLCADCVLDAVPAERPLDR